MSYYRAALAAGHAGNLTASMRLVRLSLLSGENAPNAERLLKLLERNSVISANSLDELRTIVDSRKYHKGLRVRLPQTSKAHTIRGLLYAQIGRHGAARKEFAKALALDTGNDIARRALLYY